VVARGAERRQLMAPGVPGLREAVAEDHARPVLRAGLGEVQPDPVRVDEAVGDVGHVRDHRGRAARAPGGAAGRDWRRSKAPLRPRARRARPVAAYVGERPPREPEAAAARRESRGCCIPCGDARPPPQPHYGLRLQALVAARTTPLALCANRTTRDGRVVKRECFQCWTGLLSHCGTVLPMRPPLLVC
jgi:hypothetical protein